MKPDFMAVLAAAIALDKKRRKWEFVPVKTVAGRGAHSPEVVTVTPEPEPTPPGALDTFQADTFQNDAFQ